MIASGRATWHADVSMMPSRGLALLTSAWPHADISIDRSMVVGQIGPTCQSARVADRWSPHVSAQKMKRKKENTNGFVGSKLLRA